MKPTLLAIDCGTQSLRALIFDADGALLAKAQIKYAPYRSPEPGLAEQDAEVFWKSLCDACQRLKSEHPRLMTRIAGVGVTTQRDTMVNVDQQGRPLRPAITWLDQRKARQVYIPSKVRKLVYAAVGMNEAVAKVQSDAKCNWIRQNQPDLWEQTHKYLQISGFLNFRLTGHFRDSLAAQIGHIPFNYKKLRWAHANELAARLCLVEPDKRPTLLQPGERIGTITSRASRQTGIRAGAPVLACGSDKGCETIGAGVIDPQSANLSFGTTATVQTTSARYCEPLRFMPAYPAPIPGRFNPEVEIFRGYWMITWFKNEFAHQEMMEARQKGVAVETLLDQHIANTPVGAMGLLVQPYWSPGLKMAAAKGAMIGFGDVHTKAHIYRAVIEGLGYALLDGLRSIEKATGQAVERLTASGGASQSDAICQITADIFNLPLFRGQTHETSGLGAAIVMAVGLGLYPTYPDALNKMVHHGPPFQPNPQHTAIYQQLFEKVYRQIHPSLAPLYEQIRAITGFPPAMS